MEFSVFTSVDGSKRTDGKDGVSRARTLPATRTVGGGNGRRDGPLALVMGGGGAISGVVGLNMWETRHEKSSSSRMLSGGSETTL